MTLLKAIEATTGIINGVNAAKSLFENKRKEERRQDNRQVDMQGRLNDVNAKTNKELADYEQGLKMQMWKDTNYGAQMEQATKAGLSKVAVLGGGGGGTQGASVDASGIGSGASSSASTQMANTQADLAKAQTANLMAQTSKTQAETEKIKGVDTKAIQTNTENTEFDLNIKKILQENNIRISDLNTASAELSNKQAQAAWGALKQVLTKPQSQDNDPLVKATRADLMRKVSELDALKVDIDNKKKDGILKEDDHELKELEKTVIDFKGDLTKIGINETTANIITKVLGLLFGKGVNINKKK